MPTTEYLQTVLMMRGAQQHAQDLQVVGDRYADLGARAEAAGRLLQAQNAKVDAAKRKLEALGEIARITGEQQVTALGRVEQRWSRIGNYANQGATALGTAAVAGVGAMGWLVKGAMQAEGAVAQLKIALKDDSAAQAAYQWAKRFADTTPFITQSVVEASARLQISSLDMKEWTEVAGNMAAPFISSGKDIIDSVEAIRDAVAGGGLERLKEFGITGSMLLEAGAAKAGGGGVSTATPEDVEKLKEALKKVVELKFGNAMSEAFNSTAGALSTLQGNLETFRQELGKELIPEVTEIIKDLTEWVQKLNDLDDDTKKQIITALKYGVAIGGIGAAVLKVVGFLSTWKAARAATAAANISRNLAEAASAQALAAAYEKAGMSASFKGGGSILSGVGRGALTSGNIVGTAAKPMAVSGMSKLITEVSALAVPLAAIAGSVWILTEAQRGVVQPGRELNESLNSAAQQANVALGTGQVWWNPKTGEVYRDKFPTPQEFAKAIADKYGLLQKQYDNGRIRVMYPVDPWTSGGVKRRFLEGMRNQYGATPAGSITPAADVIREAYVNWYAGFQVIQLGGVSSTRAHQIAVEQAIEQNKQQQQTDADARARDQKAEQLLAARRKRIETQQRLLDMAGNTTDLFMQQGIAWPSLRDTYYTKERGYWGGRKGTQQFPTSIRGLKMKPGETLFEAIDRMRGEQGAVLQSMMLEWDAEQKELLKAFSPDIFESWDQYTRDKFGGKYEWLRQKRELQERMMSAQISMRDKIIDFSTAAEAELIAAIEATLEAIDKGLLNATQATIEWLRGVRDEAAGRTERTLLLGGRGKDAWQLHANTLNQQFEELHGDAAKTIETLQGTTSRFIQAYEDALSYNDLSPNAYGSLKATLSAMGINVADPAQAETLKAQVYDTFKNTLDFLDDMIDKSVGTKQEQYRKLRQDIERQVTEFAAKDKAKKWEPHIAREIIATGGLSGLAELAISRVVAGGGLGRGPVGLTGPLRLSGPAMDRLRASGGMGRAGDWNAARGATSATGPYLPGMPRYPWQPSVSIMPGDDSNPAGDLARPPHIPGLGVVSRGAAMGDPWLYRSLGVLAPASPPPGPWTSHGSAGNMTPLLYGADAQTLGHTPYSQLRAESVYSAGSRKMGRSGLRIDIYDHRDEQRDADIVDKAIDGAVDFLRRALPGDAVGTMQVVP